MTDAATLLAEIADRCEKISQPDCELDAKILAVVNGGWIAEGAVIPAYTASIDAALALVPEPRSFDLSHCGNCIAHVQLIGSDPCEREPEFEGCASSPALALTAAALRARASTMRDGE